MRRLVTSPPTIGAAMRFMRSAPVPVDHMMGRRPVIAANTVIAFGRTRFTAPWMIASTRSPRVLRSPFFLYSSCERSRKRTRSGENPSARDARGAPTTSGHRLGREDAPGLQVVGGGHDE